MHNDGRYIARVRDQSLRLVRSLISVSGADGDALGIENILIAKRAFLFWNTRDTEQPGLWDSSADPEFAAWPQYQAAYWLAGAMGQFRPADCS